MDIKILGNGYKMDIKYWVIDIQIGKWISNTGYQILGNNQYSIVVVD